MLAQDARQRVQDFTVRRFEIIEIPGLIDDPILNNGEHLVARQ